MRPALSMSHQSNNQSHARDTRVCDQGELVGGRNYFWHGTDKAELSYMHRKVQSELLHKHSALEWI